MMPVAPPRHPGSRLMLSCHHLHLLHQLSSSWCLEDKFARVGKKSVRWHHSFGWREGERRGEGSSRARIRRLERSQREEPQLHPRFQPGAETTSAAEPSVTGTFKCGGKRAVKVQKRPSPSLHPPRRHWGMCLQLKKEDGGNGKSSEWFQWISPRGSFRDTSAAKTSKSSV